MIAPSKLPASSFAYIYICATLLLILPLVLASGFLNNQLLASADIILHLNRIISNTNSLREGLFYPRWYPEMFIGYGYPLPNFYPPGASLLGAGFVLIGMTPIAALISTQILALWAGVTGAYQFARHFSDPPAAFLSAAAYLYVPFLFFQLYHIGNVPQLFAFNLIPWVLWGIAHGATTPRTRTTALIAIALAVALLMHQLAGMMAVGIGTGYALVAGWSASEGSIWQNRQRYFVPLAGIALGFGLATIYWLPALTSFDAIQPLGQTTARIGASIEDNFVLLRQMLQPAQTVDQTAQTRLFQLSLGIPQIALFAISLLRLPQMLRTGSRWGATHIITGALAVSGMIFLMTYHAFQIWENVPGVDVILQPWRLFGLIYAIMIPMFALSLGWIIKRTGAWITPIVLMLLFAAILPVYFPSVDPVPDADQLRTPLDTINYENTTGNYGTVVFDEYRPTDLQSLDDLAPCDGCYADWEWTIYPQTRLLPENVTLQTLETNRLRSTMFSINTPADFDFVLHQFYFPGWRAELNGQSLPLNPTTSAGLMTATIPAGQHQLEIWYAGTPIASVAFMISLWSLVLVIALGVRKPKTGNPPLKVAPSPLPASNRVALVCVLLLIGVSLVLYFYIEPHTSWFRIARPPDAPAYMQHAQREIFSDATGTPQIELLGYDLNRDRNGAVGYGDWLYVDLYWHALQPQTTDWRVRVQLADPVLGVPFIVSDKPAPGRIATTGWSPDNYVFDRHIMRIDADIPPYMSQLEVRVYADDGTELTLASGTQAAILTQLRISETGNCPFADSTLTNIQFGDLLTVTHLAWTTDPDDAPVLNLCWQVAQTNQTDYRLFVHYYAGDTFLDNADQAPISRYPSALWNDGQILANSYTLQPPESATAVRIGFYDTATVTRLSPVGEGVAIQDNSVLVELPFPLQSR
ncbi:MAG: 6-pyruvoyl-tetrahydropterin synthase-related protein [Aggregatilineales bacterium]